MEKKRILFVGEASCLATGFSTYYRELIPRLVATGKYEIAEIGCYIRPDDPAMIEFVKGRWKWYGTMPTNEQENHIFSQISSHPRDKGQNINQFGAHIFDRVCAEFKPDLVIDIRDNWMLSWQLRSPFRKWFKWIIMPTVDALPQAEEWIQDYEQADLVLSYSDFGVHTLKQQSQRIKVFPKPLRPGVDINIFKPLDKREIREEFALKDDLPIVGCVMRNQSLLYNTIVKSYHHDICAEDITIGTKLLTAQGNIRKVTNIWTYKESKPYTRLKVFGNNIDGPSATSEHKFHFENGIKEIGKAEIRERIKMPVLPLTNAEVEIDILDYITLPDHWRHDNNDIIYDWKGSSHKYSRKLKISDRVMRLFGWYCSEGWLGNDEKIIQFGLNTNETGEQNEIKDIIENDFVDGHVTINHDKEFSSTTLSWSSRIYALLLKSLFGNGSRNKSIPAFIKTAPNSIYLAASFIEGDGSIYNPEKKNSYVLASSFSFKLANDIRDILQSHGIFTTINQSSDYDTIKTNLGIYGIWASKLGKYLQHNHIKEFVESHKGINWRNHVEWKDGYFLVPITEKIETVEDGPYYDFEVEEDFTYNVAGYACNNSRKLYPDLIDAFALMKKKYKGEAIVDKSVLMLHTSWPDNAYSYDYPRHIMRLQAYPWMPNHFRGIKDSVLQTLVCHNPECGKMSVGFAMSLHNRPVQRVDGLGNVILMPCCFCGKNSATCPTTGRGVSREQLAHVYNLMNIYVQCSICEGDGMPIQEAKSCGVPSLVVDYSAMREKGRFPKEYQHLKSLDINADNYSCNLGGGSLNVQRYYYEPETSCMRALPDIEDIADKIRNILTDQDLLAQMSLDARKSVEDNYDWDKLWKHWEYVLDNVKIKDRTNTWDSPIIVTRPADVPAIPDGLSDEQFVEWLYINVLKYPKIDPDGAKMWLANLQQGAQREQMLKQFLSIVNNDEDRFRQMIRANVAKFHGEAYTSELSNNTQAEWV